MKNIKNNFIKFLLKKKFKKIFLITGKNSFYKSGAFNLLKKKLDNKEIRFFFKKKKIPELSELKLINDNLKKFKPDLILAIGGGAIIDYAKVSNVIFQTRNLEKKIEKNQLLIKKKYPLVAVPTTAGSGAEVTSNAVIYIKKKKHSIEGKDIKPCKHFLIPDFVNRLPFKIKAESGFDAISQSIESILSNKANKESTNFASKSLEISTKSYLKFLKSSAIEDSRKMQQAANLSGKAINISKTIAPHAASYPFTSYFNINHGHAVSLTLNEFLKFNFQNMKYAISPANLKKKFQIIFRSTNTKDIFDLIELIDKFKYYANLETNFAKLNIDINKKYPIILKGVNILRLNNNPIKINLNDVKEILLKK